MRNDSQYRVKSHFAVFVYCWQHFIILSKRCFQQMCQPSAYIILIFFKIQNKLEILFTSRTFTTDSKKLTGGRLQDHWSSGYNALLSSRTPIQYKWTVDIFLSVHVALEVIFVPNNRITENPTHHENKSVKRTPPYTPLLYSKTGVYRGIFLFLIFALKHRLWVLVRTASLRRF